MHQKPAAGNTRFCLKIHIYIKYEGILFARFIFLWILAETNLDQCVCCILWHPLDFWTILGKCPKSIKNWNSNVRQCHETAYFVTDGFVRCCICEKCKMGDFFDQKLRCCHRWCFALIYLEKIETFWLHKRGDGRTMEGFRLDVLFFDSWGKFDSDALKSEFLVFSDCFRELKPVWIHFSLWNTPNILWF